LAGVAFTNYQDCMKDADRDIEANGRLSHELFDRIRHITVSVDRANTVKDLRDGLKAPTFVFSEFKDSTIQELRRKHARILKQIDTSSVTFLLPKFGFQPLWSDADGFALFIATQEIQYGHVGATAVDTDLPLLRKMAHRFWKFEKAFYRMFLASNLSPTCSMRVVFNRIRGEPFSNIVARPVDEIPDYDFEDKVDYELDE
jgi:hypothetical protein